VENIRKKNPMKKIVIDARESGTSTGRYIDKLIEYLHDLNPHFEIILLTKPHKVESLKKIAPKFQVLESPYKEFTFSEQIGFLRQLNKVKADLVHFGKTEQPVLYRGKTVTTIHDLTTARFRNPSKNWLVFTFKLLVYRWVVKEVAFKSRAVIVPSEYVKKDLQAYAKISLDKISVTYEATDKITDAQEAIESLTNKQFIMYVGRPQPHKNLNRLVQAFAELKMNHPDLRLVFVGKSDVLYKNLELYVKKQKVSNVIFTGYVSEGRLRWLYEHAAAYVFPSLSEGFGLPPLEAMIHGAPIVSSNATCLPEIYGDAAHYFDPTDVDDMARKIDEVLSNPKLREELVEKGKIQVKKYSWKRMTEQTLDVYKKVLEEK
jgi:glycosyltransferase involved in cell wall biosynthesis